MKRVEGRSLQEVLADVREGASEWSLHRLLTAFVRVCEAVAYAHERHVLHRDLKPANIMLGPFGEVLVLDWGVARFGAAGPDGATGADSTLDTVDPTLTALGAVVGTPSYMAPEQYRKEPLDGRADVFALGAVLFEILALEPAFTGSFLGVMSAILAIERRSPRDVRPEVPAEIADVAVRALATDRSQRYPDAAALGRAVEAFLEGRRRREQADAFVDRAARAARQWGAARSQVAELRERVAEVEGATQPWLPLSEKAGLLAVRGMLRQADRGMHDALEITVTEAEKALGFDPRHAGARRLLAEVYRTRFDDAEGASRPEDARYFAARIRLHDDGGLHAAWLQGTGRLLLATEPPGAQVLVRKFDEGELIWRLGPPRSLGTTPLDVPLEMGSYVLTVVGPGLAPTLYPVHIRRGQTWDASVPVPLHRADQIGEGWIYVPPGPFRFGGDPNNALGGRGEDRFEPGFFIQSLPITMSQYCDFLSDLHARDPDAAWWRVPRRVPAVTGVDDGGQYFVRPGPAGRYEVPDKDSEGDPWDPRWPVSAISFEDAAAYVAWERERTGIDVRLPRTSQWEKAARGVDGRLYPWGNEFDPSLCKMRLSRPSNPHPEPIGTFETDVSVYGVRDLAGSARDFCSLEEPEGGRTHCTRGGSWNTVAIGCRLTYVMTVVPGSVDPYYSFRMVRTEPLG